MQNYSDDIQNLVSATAGIAKVTPKGVDITRYGPDGKSVAYTGRANYSRATADGAHVDFATSVQGGARRSRSNIAIDANGQAVNARTEVIDGKGNVSRRITGDYSQLVMTEAGTPASGKAAIRITDANDKKLFDGAMSYENETFANYSQAAYDPDTGAPGGNVEVDYSGVKTLGLLLVGGTLALHHTRPDGSLAFKTASRLTSYGVPDQVETIGYKDDGTTRRTSTNSNYTGLTFNALRKVNNGTLLVATSADDGTLTNKTQFRFSSGKLVGVNNVTDSAMDAIAVVSPYPVLAATGPNVPAAAPDKTSELKRPDGTLLQKRQDWLVTNSAGNKVPRLSLVTGYTIDGSTVVRQVEVDFSAVSFGTDGSDISGAAVSTKYEGGARSSIAHIHY